MALLQQKRQQQFIAQNIKDWTKVNQPKTEGYMKRPSEHNPLSSKTC